MYHLLRMAIENPVTSISLLVLAVQMIVKTVINIKARDLYGLYLSFSCTGVELSLLTLVTFLGISVSKGKEMLSKCYGTIGDDGQMIWYFFVTLCAFIVPLCLSIWVFAEAGNLGRDKFSVLLKAPTVRKMFVPDAAQLMLRAVAQERYYRSGDGAVKGFIFAFTSVGLGSFATAFLLKFIIERV